MSLQVDHSASGEAVCGMETLLADKDKQIDQWVFHYFLYGIVWNHLCLHFEYIKQIVNSSIFQSLEKLYDIMLYVSHRRWKFVCVYNWWMVWVQGCGVQRDCEGYWPPAKASKGLVRWKRWWGQWRHLAWIHDTGKTSHRRTAKTLEDDGGLVDMKV